jgi:peptide/nickel transport system ATP-binding protein
MTALSPLHTIGNQVGETLKVHNKTGKGELRSRVEEMLQLVGFPNPARAYDMYPFEMSGGLRQRAVIAMALICRPALLIADEPTTALDVTIQAQILELLRELQEKLNMAMLLITHDLGVVANSAHEVVVIYHGEIMEAGSVEHIFRAPEHVYLKSLMAAVPHFRMQPGERLKALREVKVDAHTLTRRTEARREPDGTPLLTVKELVKSYQPRGSFWSKGRSEKALRAVDSINLDIRRGECLGLVGESGCGKTTVSKIIMRAVTPDSGSVIFHGAEGPIDVLGASGPELERLRTKIQMVFQDPFSSLSPRMTVKNIISEPLEIHNRGDAASRSETVKDLLRSVGLDPRFLNRYPHSFSGGQRQRIGIARALALGPELLICDEPVSALDVSVQAQILNMLKDFQTQIGLTYLFISHNLAVVNYMADRIAVMCRGRIVELAPRDTLFRNPVHPYTRALLSAIPYADLDRPLDYHTMQLNDVSNSQYWPEQFRDTDADDGLAATDLGNGHSILARRSAGAEMLRSW